MGERQRIWCSWKSMSGGKPKHTCRMLIVARPTETQVRFRFAPLCPPHASSEATDRRPSDILHLPSRDQAAQAPHLAAGRRRRRSSCAPSYASLHSAHVWHHDSTLTRPRRCAVRHISHRSQTRRASYILICNFGPFVKVQKLFRCCIPAACMLRAMRSNTTSMHIRNTIRVDEPALNAPL